jgi:hypothetical protein
MSNIARRTRPALALALLLIVLLAVGLAPAAAQTATPLPGTTPAPFAATIELVGLVQAVGPNTITVNGQVVDTSFAEFNSLITVGAPVKVEGSVNAFGQIVAREVRAADLSQRGMRPGEIEVVGPLTGMTGPRLTIAGLPMDASRAEFGPGVGLGQLVKVHVTLDASNQWIIREIELASADDASDFNTRPAGEFEITGTLQSVSPGQIVVNGLVINTSGAEIKNALVPGALVKVHLSQVNGQWVAREVELAGNDDSRDDSPRPAGEFEIYGTISEIGSGFIVVNGQRISTTGAEIEGPLAVGSFVKVHLSNLNGQWVAREVELSDRTSDDNSGSDDRGGSDNSGSDDNSGSGSDDSGSDDNSGSGSDDSGSDDHSGSGSDDSGSDDNSGSGSDDSGSDDHSGSGSDDSGSDDSGDDHGGDNSGSDDGGDD